MDYNEAVTYIEQIPKFTKKNDYRHTRLFLDQLLINEEQMKIIHVAGTNGKGTVCAFISNILTLSGKKTGLFTSPHLISMNERIRINNEMIDNETFLEAFLVVKQVSCNMVSNGLSHPSFFEFLFGMAMYIFQKQQVEYLVLEVGLGGRLDATNVVKNPLCCVITSIGLDHMEYLGDTIEQIAYEKAGIIKENTKVVYWGENKVVAEIIRKKAVEKGCEYTSVTMNDYIITKKTNKSVDFYVNSGYYLNDMFSIPFIAKYQVMNAMIALRTIENINSIRENVSIIKKGIATVRWEGRMEMVMPSVYFDGAHNGPGIEAFIRTFNEYICTGKKIILFSVVKDKDYDDMVSQLVKTDVSIIIITQIDSIRGLSATRIQEDFKKHTCKAKVITIAKVKEAFEQALQLKEEKDVLFCVGSLYLIGELKQNLNNIKNKYINETNGTI